MTAIDPNVKPSRYTIIPAPHNGIAGGRAVIISAHKGLQLKEIIGKTPAQTQRLAEAWVKQYELFLFRVSVKILGKKKAAEKYGKR